MVVSAKSEIQELKPGVKAPVRETLLTPRFYTTDFEAMARMDLSPQQEELEAMLAEMKADYNQRHFVRTDAFKDHHWEDLDEETQVCFIDFLERSCTSEFSGFLLFKEISRQVQTKNPLLSEIFALMARDEARHAGFLNKSMTDFNISLDLGYLTKNRQYTFFKPEWVIYAVYLSEKIGYWRYITMYRHLERHPELKFYPIFDMFENWCQDENRHGDIFNALLRSQPPLWSTWRSRLWSRFFLLTVFMTHTLTVLERSEFYERLGLDPVAYDRTVIEKTNETAARAFPTILDVNHPRFFPTMYEAAAKNAKMQAIDRGTGPKWWKSLQKLPIKAGILMNFVSLYLIPGVDAEGWRSQVK